jgi:hypothetical protein
MARPQIWLEDEVLHCLYKNIPIDDGDIIDELECTVGEYRARLRRRHRSAKTIDLQSYRKLMPDLM